MGVNQSSSDSKSDDAIITLSDDNSSSGSYAKEIAAYQQEVYNNPRPSHQLLHQLSQKMDPNHDSHDPKAEQAKMQHKYANSIAVLNNFWMSNVNTLSDADYSALCLTFYTNVYNAIPEAHPIFKSRLKREASVQSKIFFGMFGWLVHAITQPDCSQLTRKIAILGTLHDSMGVKLPHYLKMGGAFHETMQHQFKQEYTMRVRFCFNTLYEIVVNVMLGLDFRHKCAQQKDKMAAFMEHIEDFEDCLNNEDTLEYLIYYMKHQLCGELALYYKDYIAYKSCADGKQRNVKGEEMKRLYIDPDSEREINISSFRRNIFNSAVKSKGYNDKTFDAISVSVLKLIRRNCWHGFQLQIKKVYEEIGAKKKQSPKEEYHQNWNFLVNRLNQTNDSDQPY